MRFSIFSHRGTEMPSNSEELRRDDVDCFTERDLRRQTNALEDSGWEIQEVMKGGYQAGKPLKTNTGRSSQQARTRR